MNVLSMTKSLVAAVREWIDSCDEKRFVWFALAAYIVLAVANIITHEMWGDEMQHWLIAKDSHSLRELFHNLGYDGHPPLWNLMLYALTRVTHNPAAMQYLHLAIAVASAYVFLRFAPFTRLQSLLFVFGYYPLYEYAAISRNYAIGVLLLFVICTVYRAGAGKKYLLLAVLLFLLAQTNAYGFLIVVSITGTLVFEFLVDKEVRAYVCCRKSIVLSSICIVLTGLVISAVVMIPEPDSHFAGIWTTRIDFKQLQETLVSVWQSYVPIPRLTHAYWNSNIFPGRTVPSVLAVPLLCFVFFLSARKRIPFVLFCSSTFLILVFQYVKYMGSMRHWGHLFIMFIVCLWLGRSYSGDAEVKWRFLQKPVDYCRRCKGAFIGTLLAIHFAAGIHASAMEWLYPFSQAKNAAIYIEQNHLDKLPIVGYVDHAASAVAGYLGREIYYAGGDKAGSFVIFNRQWVPQMDESTMLERVRRVAAREKSDVLLVLYQKLRADDESVIEMSEFTGSIKTKENFYLYLLKYPAE